MATRRRDDSSSARRRQPDRPAAFQDAVIEGLRLLDRSRSTAQTLVRDAFDGAQETLQSRLGGALGQAQETWDNIEALFQSRVQRALQQIGVPDAAEIRMLTQRVAELNESVRKLDARAGVRKTARKASQPGTPSKRKSAPSRSRVPRRTGGASR